MSAAGFFRSLPRDKRRWVTDYARVTGVLRAQEQRLLHDSFNLEEVK
jgi:hypothetical protein